MPLTSLTQVFPGATVSGFAINIPSGSLVSCKTPSSGDPNEVILGVLETVHRAVASGLPSNISTGANAVVLNSTTYRKVYSFTVDMEFNGDNLIETLNVKAES